MSNWTGGYVAGIDYTFGFQPELCPLRIRLALTNAGVVAPRIATACELGFGQGMTANLHAAGCGSQWFGTDFNPGHAAFAQEVAASSGADARFADESFADFCSRTDLPDFDFIGLHGVWSWTTDENRRIIVDFLHRKLKVGGVVYISYNTQPGFAALLPLHDLLSRFADATGEAQRAPGARVDAALNFAHRLLAVSPQYANAHGLLAAQLKSIKNEDRRYLAHEYLNRDWLPTSFCRVEEWLSPAKLDFVCGAHHFHTVDAWNLSREQMAMLAEIPAGAYRETVRDLMTNKSFRMDYWVKGARSLLPLERLEALRSQRVMLLRPRGEVRFTGEGALGEFAFLESQAAPLLDALADHQPKTMGQIEQLLIGKGVELSQIIDLAMMFSNIGAIAPVQEDPEIQAARPRTDRLNDFLCRKALKGADIRVLASPVTGTGFIESGGRIALFFLYGVARGARQPAVLGAQALQTFRALGIGIFKEGKLVESTEESLSILTTQASFFIEKQLPVLKAMQIA